MENVSEQQVSGQVGPNVCAEIKSVRLKGMAGRFQTGRKLLPPSEWSRYSYVPLNYCPCHGAQGPEDDGFIDSRKSMINTAERQLTTNGGREGTSEASADARSPQTRGLDPRRVVSFPSTSGSTSETGSKSSGVCLCC